MLKIEETLIKESKIIYINSNNLKTLDIFNFKNYLNKIKQAYTYLEENKVILTKSEYLKYPNRSAYDRIIPLLGNISGDINISGIKIIGSSIDNEGMGFPRASALLVLFDSNTQRPFAILEGAEISAIRTATVSAIALSYLKPITIQKVACIGCGYLQKIHLTMWKQLFPCTNVSFSIFDKSPKASLNFMNFANELKINVQIEDSAEKAIKGADVIIPATTETIPYIEDDWIKKESLFLAVSLLDPKLKVLENSELIVVDDISSCLQEGRPLQQLQKKGILPNEKIKSIGRIILDDCYPRKNNIKRIFFNPMGTVITDIAVAFFLIEKAIELKKVDYLSF